MRDGLNPTRLHLAHGTGWGSVGEFLSARFPDDVPRLRERFADGEIVDELGRPFAPGSPYVAGALVFLFRDPPVERRVPFEVEILHRDDDLLVVDKPHFFATTPGGAHVIENVLVRLRRDLDLPELSPAHRLDRPTAGVLVLTMRREVRGAYQELFAERMVTKIYEAVTALRPDVELPRTVRSRIYKQHGVLQAQETAGEPNAETLVELTREVAPPVGPLGLLRLTPRTGRTHQLRVHLASLGMPIVNDNLYPVPYDVPVDDFSAPLQLLARSVGFTDPLSGLERTFTSRRHLAFTEPVSPAPRRAHP